MTDNTENAVASTNGVPGLPAGLSNGNTGMSLMDQAIAHLTKAYPDANPAESLTSQDERRIQGEALDLERPIEKTKASIEPSEEDEFLRAFGEKDSIDDADDGAEVLERITLEDLANQYKTTPQDLLNKLIVKTKINDVENDLPLSDVLRGYQTDKSVTERSQALAAKEKELEALGQDYGRRQAQVNQSLNTANELINHYYQELEREYNSISWEQVREEDENRYNTLRLDYYQKKQNLDDCVNKLGSEFQKQQHQLTYDEQLKQQEQAMQMQRHMQQQQHRMLELMPELKEEKVRNVFRDRIEKRLTSFYGFSAEEFNSEIFKDARFMPIIRDAELYRSMKEGNVKDKIVKNAPKVVKPQSRTGRQTEISSSLRVLKDEAFQKKDVASAIAYLKAAHAK